MSIQESHTPLGGQHTDVYPGEPYPLGGLVEGRRAPERETGARSPLSQAEPYQLIQNLYSSGYPAWRLASTGQS